MLLDRNSPLPLYAQLKELLENKIKSNEWIPDTQIPTEDQLCKEYNVSRTTVRQALAELKNEGLLTRLPGSGTFVNEKPIKLDLGPLTGFTQDMIHKKKSPGAKVVDLIKVSASNVIAEKLDIPPGTEIFKLTRVRMANGEPMAVEIAHLNCRLCPDFINHDLNNQSLYQILTDEFGLIPSSAVQQVMALPCPEEFASLLDITPGSPVLRMQRRTNDQHGRPLEWVIAHYRGDKYILEVELRKE